MAAINLLFLTANRMLRVGSSLVTESSFYRQLSSEQAGEIADSAKAKVSASRPPSSVIMSNANTKLAPVPPAPTRGIISGTGETLTESRCTQTRKCGVRLGGRRSM